MSLPHFSTKLYFHPNSRNCKLSNQPITKSITSLNFPSKTQSILVSSHKRPIHLSKPHIKLTYKDLINQSSSSFLSFLNRKSIKKINHSSIIEEDNPSITALTNSKRLKELKCNYSHNHTTNRKKICTKEQKDFVDIITKKTSLRQIKRKVCKLMTNCPLIICDSFNRNNNNFNEKFMTLITGDNYFDKSKLYHCNFHYHSNDISEGHDKYNMLIDCDKFKRALIPQTVVFNNNFTNVEKKVISQDPSYFFSNIDMIEGVKGLKNKPLKDKLNDEEKQRRTMNKSDYSNDYDNSKFNQKQKVNSSERKNKALRDPRFNWTKFDFKIDDAISSLKEKLNKAHSMKELIRSNIQPVLPPKIQHEVDEDFRRILNKKLDMKIRVNFNTTLPRREYRYFMNREVSKRLINEIKIFKDRQVFVRKQNDEAYYQQETMDKIRDNIMERKKDELSSGKLHEKQESNQDKLKAFNLNE